MTSTTLARKGFVAPTEERDPVERVVRGPNYRTPAVPEPPRDERHALALFCFDGPDSFVGAHVRRLAPALARRGVPVHVFAPHAFEATDDVTVHAVGECDGADLMDQVDEFTHRAVNAFLRRFPNGGPPVTLMGFEWPAAPALSLLHGIKDVPVVASFHSLERQRSDLSGDLARQIDEIERRALRESQAVLFHDGASAEISKYWVPEVADRIVNARRPFATAPFEGKLDPARSRLASRSARWTRPSCASAT